MSQTEVILFTQQTYVPTKEINNMVARTKFNRSVTNLIDILFFIHRTQLNKNVREPLHSELLNY